MPLPSQMPRARKGGRMQRVSTKEIARPKSAEHDTLPPAKIEDDPPVAVTAAQPQSAQIQPQTNVRFSEDTKKHDGGKSPARSASDKPQVPVIFPVVLGTVIQTLPLLNSDGTPSGAEVPVGAVVQLQMPPFEDTSTDNKAQFVRACLVDRVTGAWEHGILQTKCAGGETTIIDYTF